jgi:hypothetical protein
MLSDSVVPNRAALALVCSAVVAASCAKPEERTPGPETAAGAVAPAPATSPPATAAAISLAAVAGKWKMQSMDPSGANVLNYELTIPRDSSNWTVVGPGGRSLTVRVVSVGGDSIVAEAGPYESFLRKGVQITQREVFRLRDGKLVSTLEGHYATPKGDSTAQRRTEGTRMP